MVPICPKLSLICAAIILALSGCGTPSKSFSISGGQFEDSPDKKLSASAMFDPDDRLAYEIIDTQSKQVYWKLECGNRKEGDPPFDQGFGNIDLIQWSDDSREVRFAFRSQNVTDVVQWLAVSLDGEKKITASMSIVDIGFHPADRRQTKD
jgi:hypothetical protein